MSFGVALMALCAAGVGAQEERVEVPPVTPVVDESERIRVIRQAADSSGSGVPDAAPTALEGAGGAEWENERAAAIQVAEARGGDGGVVTGELAAESKPRQVRVGIRPRVNFVQGADILPEVVPVPVPKEAKLDIPIFLEDSSEVEAAEAGSLRPGDSSRADVPLVPEGVEPNISPGLGVAVSMRNEIADPNPERGDGDGESGRPVFGSGSRRDSSFGPAVSRVNRGYDPVSAQEFVHPAVVADSPPDGVAPAYRDTWSDGYFPTLDDKLYLGDRDGRRGLPGNHRGPDFRSQAATGLVPYDDPDVSFYDRHSYVFDPLERGLGFLTPWRGATMEFDRLDGAHASLGADWPFFTTTLDPDKAHLKAGPLYLDLMSVGAGMLYSDYSGPKTFDEGAEDGFLSYIGLNFRAYVRATERFYFSAVGRVIYLPGVNEVGFRIGAGDGGLGAGAQLGYQFSIKSWDYLFYNRFRASQVASFYSSDGEGADDSAGRYRFGISDSYRRTAEFIDTDGGVFSNRVGLIGTSPIGQDWRKMIRADHTDYWRGYDFDNHSKRDHLGALVGYNGTRIPFAPYARYDVDSYDSFDSSFHRVYLGGRGRLSENVTLGGRAGYLWAVNSRPDREKFLWNLGLTHRINARTSHTLSGGQDFVSNGFTDEHGIRDFVGYSLTRRVSEHVQASLFAQWSRNDPIGNETEWEREQYGANVRVNPWDYTRFYASIYQQRTHSVPGDDVTERLIVTAGSTHHILSRTTLHFYYRFEDAETFDEHLTGMEIRRHF